MHHVPLHLLHPHRLERAGPDVQRDECMPDPPRFEGSESFRIEMQARRGRRHRAEFTCIDSLIPIAIRALRCPLRRS